MAREVCHNALRVSVSCLDGELEGRVIRGDIDGRFELLNDDDGQRYSVNGWCCDIEVLNENERVI